MKRANIVADLLSLLKPIEARFPWGVIGVAATLIVFWVTSIFWFIDVTGDDDPSMDLSVSITSEGEVLSVKKPVSNLKILFQNEDIVKSGLGLRWVTLHIENTGTRHILEQDFAEKPRWGVVLQQGTAISAELAQTNSKYLTKALLPIEIIGDTVSWQKAMFESGMFFEIDIIILAEKDSLSSLAHIGKIAGVPDSVEITGGDPARQEPVSKIDSYLNGAKWIVLALLFLALNPVCFPFVAFWAIFAYTKGRRDKRILKKRREFKDLSQGLTISGSGFSLGMSLVGKIYAECGDRGTRSLLKQLESSGTLFNLTAKATGYPVDWMPEQLLFYLLEAKGLTGLYVAFRNGGVTIEEEESIVVDKSFYAALKAFLEKQ